MIELGAPIYDRGDCNGFLSTCLYMEYACIIIWKFLNVCILRILKAKVLSQGVHQMSVLPVKDSFTCSDMVPGSCLSCSWRGNAGLVGNPYPSSILWWRWQALPPVVLPVLSGYVSDAVITAVSFGSLLTVWVPD